MGDPVRVEDGRADDVSVALTKEGVGVVAAVVCAVDADRSLKGGHLSLLSCEQAADRP